MFHMTDHVDKLNSTTLKNNETMEILLLDSSDYFLYRERKHGHQ